MQSRATGPSPPGMVGDGRLNGASGRGISLRRRIQLGFSDGGGAALAKQDGVGALDFGRAMGRAVVAGQAKTVGGRGRG